MTTVQIIGVAVAGAAALLLVVALIVTRRAPGDGRTGEPSPGESFLDGTPQDTLAGLGKAERPVEDPALDSGPDDAAAAEPPVEAASPARRERAPQPGGLGLDWGPDLRVRPSAGGPDTTSAVDRDEASGAPRELPPDDQGATSELPAGDGGARVNEEAPPAPEGESGGQAADSEPARLAEGGSAAGTAAKESGSSSRLVPLSDIIVTTSGKLVDLADPEVRRMLTQLLSFEIDQAADFRRQGQTIDAVLQLTEAEKVARALGMVETAQRIRAMVEDIGRGE